MFLFSKASRPVVGPTKPAQWVPGVKWPGPEADHSFPSSAEVKNEWSCTSTHFICRRGVGRVNSYCVSLLDPR